MITDSYQRRELPHDVTETNRLERLTNARGSQPNHKPTTTTELLQNIVTQAREC